MPEIIRPKLYPECANCEVASHAIQKAVAGPPIPGYGGRSMNDITEPIRVSCADRSYRSGKTLWLVKTQRLDMQVMVNDLPYWQNVTNTCPGRNK